MVITMIELRNGKRPVKMKETTFFNDVLPSFEKVCNGIYQSKKTGKTVEFK